MSRSQEDLANLALGYLVRGTIRSLDGSSVEAVQTKQYLELAKELVIEEYDWPECRVITPLTEVTLSNNRGWTYTYGVPSDLVKLWALTDGTVSRTPILYERGMSDDVTSDKSYIFTNQAGAYIRYGSSRVSISRFSPQIFNLIGLRLAILCCLPLTKDAKLQNNLLNLYRNELGKVKTLVINSEPEIIDLEFTPESIRVRSE